MYRNKKSQLDKFKEKMYDLLDVAVDSEKPYFFIIMVVFWLLFIYSLYIIIDGFFTPELLIKPVSDITIGELNGLILWSIVLFHMVRKAMK